MKKLALSALALVASAPLFAQAGYVYSPSSMASTEGKYYSYYSLGRYPNMQAQQCDAELKAGGKRTLNEIAVRHDYYSYTTTYGMGRTWTNVTIKMCEGDVATFGSTISKNRLTAQTQVFSAAVTWPTQSGRPTTTPATWGGSGGKLKFPFTTKWVYSANQDVLSEWRFAGGKLANSATWGSTTSKYYRFDSFDPGMSPTGSVGGSQTYLPTVRLNNSTTSTPPRTTCNDSNMTYTTGAYMYSYSYTYGSYYSNHAWRNMLRLYSYNYYTGYDMPTIIAYSVDSDPTGINVFNTGCNKLHLKGPIVMMVTLKTPPKSISTNAYSGYRAVFVPWIKGMAGVKLTAQSAWTDSKLNKLLLSNANVMTLPIPLPQVKRNGGYAYSLTRTTLSGRSTSYSYNPGLRYGHD